MAPRRTHRVAGESPPAHDVTEPLLGPSDSSDSGSDVAYTDAHGPLDTDAPVDVVLAQAEARPRTGSDQPGLAGSDAAGTGERRTAASDPGQHPEAFDVWVDRIVDPLIPDADDTLEPDLLDWLSGQAPEATDGRSAADGTPQAGAPDGRRPR